MLDFDQRGRKREKKKKKKKRKGGKRGNRGKRVAILGKKREGGLGGIERGYTVEGRSQLALLRVYMRAKLRYSSQTDKSDIGIGRDRIDKERERAEWSEIASILQIL